jgi:phage shock protein PspC (stress-responsive transcriptional regulator)
MLEFFREGGVGMFPVLAFGLVVLGAAARFAWDAELVRLRFIWAMLWVNVATSLHATVVDLSAVLRYVSDAPSDTFPHQVLLVGLMESLRPMAMGGAFIVFALVLVAVGAYRAERRELQLA